ncbi:hypothetical protein METHB2_220047 [Candidatus Methylobacter favarea]|uniref:Uncharacterized protein n=1 Tax=Candidatus Methylobacter favarea TaxID=2707345 RepID=A0A8S0WNN4_9GAMM|nr:hypothetical protein METHB2_220047 [Candidatus Methylobacter favarea]
MKNHFINTSNIQLNYTCQRFGKQFKPDTIFTRKETPLITSNLKTEVIIKNDVSAHPGPKTVMNGRVVRRERTLFSYF